MPARVLRTVLRISPEVTSATPYFDRVVTAEEHVNHNQQHDDARRNKQTIFKGRTHGCVSIAAAWCEGAPPPGPRSPPPGPRSSCPRHNYTRPQPKVYSPNDRHHAQASSAPPATPSAAGGARGNLPGRFERQTYEPDPGIAEMAPHPDTELIAELSKSIISRNNSPDVGFDRSINPYRGCEHGCIYCYARPSHAYLDFSPGLDFETKIVHKPNAADLLKRELARPRYECKPIALGVNTDCYQPFEKQLRSTRALLEILLEARHPVAIVTKSALVERDFDLLSEMAQMGLTHVILSITTLDEELKRRMEPRAASPRRRLATIERLTEAGIPAGVMFAPVIPALNDHELESILEASAKAGALWAGYTVLRLPNEVRPLFKDWLAEQYPLKAKHVMSRVRQIRGGKENDSSFGRRMRGQGLYADLLRQRFDHACRRHGLNGGRRPELDCALFRPPPAPPKPPRQQSGAAAPNENQLSLLP